MDRLEVWKDQFSRLYAGQIGEPDLTEHAKRFGWEARKELSDQQRQELRRWLQVQRGDPNEAIGVLDGAAQSRNRWINIVAAALEVL